MIEMDVPEDIKDLVNDLLSPPDGLSLREQAQWWLRNPDMFMYACVQKTISDEVMQEIELAAKDNDLAMKVADRDRVDGLSNEERRRLFCLLTGGAEISEPRRGRPSMAVADLRIANSVRGISDPEVRKQALHDAVIASGFVAEDSAYRRIKRIEDLWRAVSHFKPEVLDQFLHECSDEKSFSEDDIVNLLAVFTLIEERFDEDAKLLNRPPLYFRRKP